ncbi:ArsC family reductase [Thalassotalea aquiviva]|uniref:ArsC family reductase n=1 Tax=Thalassotalea aquiviva TaxID=3242415 RepID=UPI00352A51A0
MTTLYGIHNCDTVKKARKWLETEGIDYVFHDLRKDGCSRQLIEQFCTKASWAELINKRSATFRNLPEEIKHSLDGEVAAEAVLQQPTLLKRPLLLNNEQLHLGFKANTYQELFNK